ncbi:MAG: tRNA (adenosine(37)-N6)-threonylcarbamoyltransferase complex dimerization subunit type 1 TsaB, partial [Actinomycetota bacterium]|nr:tRNA (adenosine(37)-N6)-threonylcarbamoyltransferase complex dimerization subunit type 1 TsaB [Actinomycetota bacterium]
MLVLAIETSTPQTSIALGTQQGVLASQLVSWARGHSEVVIPGVQSLLRLTEIKPSQISGVAVGLGPGLFTGLRVGISTARALAQVLRLPIVGIGSLDVLAFSVRHTRSRIGAV